MLDSKDAVSQMYSRTQYGSKLKKSTNPTGLAEIRWRKGVHRGLHNQETEIPVKPTDQKNNDGKPPNDKGGREVTVAVNYQARTETETFSRDTKIEEVLVWAVGIFGIDASLATEMELVITGQQDELSVAKPLATIVRGASTVTLDLVRGDIANGSL